MGPFQRPYDLDCSGVPRWWYAIHIHRHFCCDERRLLPTTLSYNRHSAIGSWRRDLDVRSSPKRQLISFAGMAISGSLMRKWRSKRARSIRRRRIIEVDEFGIVSWRRAILGQSIVSAVWLTSTTARLDRDGHSGPHGALQSGVTIEDAAKHPLSIRRRCTAQG